MKKGEFGLKRGRNSLNFPDLNLRNGKNKPKKVQKCP